MPWGREVNDEKEKAESLLVAQFNQIRQICGEDMDFRVTERYLTGLLAAEGIQQGVDFQNSLCVYARGVYVF